MNVNTIIIAFIIAVVAPNNLYGQIGEEPPALEDEFDLIGWLNETNTEVDYSFEELEEKFNEFDKIQLGPSHDVVETNFDKRIELLTELFVGYNNYAESRTVDWEIFAKTRIGDVFLSLRDAFLNAEPPPEIHPSIWEELPYENPARWQYEEDYYNYVGLFEEYGYVFEEAAIESYLEAISLAENSGVFNDYYDIAYKKMLMLQPYDVIKYDDIALYGLRSDDTWLVSSSVKGSGWTDLNFDDSNWEGMVVSKWKEEDLKTAKTTLPGKPSPIWNNTTSKTAYFRKKVSATFLTDLTAYIRSRGGKYELYIDGVLLGKNTQKNAWKDPGIYDVSELLKPGDHIIAIKTERGPADSYGLMFSIEPGAGFLDEAYYSE